MTRQEFIVTLREGIRKLPPEEIVAATEFYEEYFDEVLEAGEKTEEEIVSELGNPRRIASQIKADYAARLLDGNEDMLGEKPTVKKKLSAAWWVVIGIASAPVSIPAAICAFCLLIGAICLALGLAAGIIGGAVGAVVTVIFGFVALADAVSSGILLIGIGLIVLAAMTAAGFGLFLGVRALVKAIAKAIRRGREKRRIKKLAADKSAGEEWVYVSQADEDEKAFLQEIAADAAEQEALEATEAGNETEQKALEAPVGDSAADEYAAVERGEDHE